LKTRGVADILIAVTDGLKGMPEALAAVFPATTLQTCIVHLIRNSLDYASWKDRKALAAAIKPIYTAPSAEAAASELDAFEQGAWGRRFPTVVVPFSDSRPSGAVRLRPSCRRTWPSRRSSWDIAITSAVPF
jgi:transposase-like protein